MTVVVAGVSRSDFSRRCAVTTISGKSYVAICSAAVCAACASPAKLTPVSAAATASIQVFFLVIVCHLSLRNCPHTGIQNHTNRSKRKALLCGGRKGLRRNYKRCACRADALTSESPSLSLAGQTAIVNQAVLLAPAHRIPAPSQETPPSDVERTDASLCRCAH